MKLLSVNVALPRIVSWNGRTYPTAYFKQPVEGRVKLRRLNIEGDAQGNLTTHGGVDMAVYAYPWDHYPYWRGALKDDSLGFGAFGENLTVTGMTEDAVHIGDTFRIGSATVQVSEPRTPCHKLAMRYDSPDLPKRFLEAGRVGFYFRVIEPGEIGAGDAIEPLARDPLKLSVLEVLRVWEAKRPEPGALARALSCAALSPRWRGQLGEKLGGKLADA